MIIVYGTDAATQGAALEMAKNGKYGRIVTNHQEAAEALAADDVTVNIVSHSEAANDLNGKTPSKVTDDLVETFRLFDQKQKAAKYIYIQACYSSGFAEQLVVNPADGTAGPLVTAIGKKGVSFVKTFGTDGLNVLDLQGNSRVLKPDAYAPATEPEANWKAFEEVLAGGKINESRWKSLIEPKLQPDGEGWVEWPN